MSLAQALVTGEGVVGADLVVAEFDRLAQESMDGHGGGVVLADGQGALLARDAQPEFSQPPVTRLENLARSANGFVAAAATLAEGESSRIMTVQGKEMVYARGAVHAAPGRRLWVTAFSALDAFIAPLRAVQRDMQWLALAYALSRWLGRSLDGLMQQSQRIRNDDFSGDECPEFDPPAV